MAYNDIRQHIFITADLATAPLSLPAIGIDRARAACQRLFVFHSLQYQFCTVQYNQGLYCHK